MSKTAFITGITGQDGSYLAELLLEKGYTVHGMVRRSSSFNRGRIEHLYENPKLHESKLVLHYGDMLDTACLTRLLEKAQPDEVYNLAAQSHVKVSFEIPEYTAQVDALGTLRLLDAVRETGLKPKIYHASTSELFGKVQEVPQSEKTPFYPRSPYGVAKLYAYWLIINYREAYGLFAVNGVLFNHESPRRHESFVSRKVTLGVARVANGQNDPLIIGNLDARRDWGYAPEYVEGMWRMLQHDRPEDFVMATGESHTVRQLVDRAFACIGKSVEWKGTGVDEVGYEAGTKKALVRVDPTYFRPTEVDHLVGDAKKAQDLLGWKPKVRFGELVDLMVKADLARLRGELSREWGKS